MLKYLINFIDNSHTIILMVISFIGTYILFYVTNLITNIENKLKENPEKLGSFDNLKGLAIFCGIMSAVMILIFKPFFIAEVFIFILLMFYNIFLFFFYSATAKHTEKDRNKKLERLGIVIAICLVGYFIFSIGYLHGQAVTENKLLPIIEELQQKN